MKTFTKITGIKTIDRISQRQAVLLRQAADAFFYQDPVQVHAQGKVQDAMQPTVKISTMPLFTATFATARHSPAPADSLSHTSMEHLVQSNTASLISAIKHLISSSCVKFKHEPKRKQNCADKTCSVPELELSKTRNIASAKKRPTAAPKNSAVQKSFSEPNSSVMPRRRENVRPELPCSTLKYRPMRTLKRNTPLTLIGTPPSSMLPMSTLFSSTSVTLEFLRPLWLPLWLPLCPRLLYLSSSHRQR